MVNAPTKKPEDFVIATGKQYSVRDFINESAKNLNMKIEWRGHGVEEVGYFNDKDVVVVDKRYFRPSEVENLLGEATKAKEKLNWSPKISFEELVKEMVDEDFKLVNKVKINVDFKKMSEASIYCRP